jgi:hypothetical protein
MSNPEDTASRVGQGANAYTAEDGLVRDEHSTSTPDVEAAIERIIRRRLSQPTFLGDVQTAHDEDIQATAREIAAIYQGLTLRAGELEMENERLRVGLFGGVAMSRVALERTRYGKPLNPTPKAGRTG